MKRLITSMLSMPGKKLLTGGVAAAMGFSLLGGAAPASAVTHTYKVVPDTNTMKLSDWTNCDATCRSDLRSPDGVYILPSNSPDISADQWKVILKDMTNNSTAPVYAEDLYACASVTPNEGRRAWQYTGRLDGWMLYHEPNQYTCGNVIDTFPSNTLSPSELNQVGTLTVGNATVAGKIIVHSRAYDALQEGSYTRAQRIDMALSNSNTGALMIEQNPQYVSTPGWNIVNVLNKAITMNKGAALLVPPTVGEQNYLGKIHSLMKYLEQYPGTNLLGKGVVIVPAVYDKLIGIPYATSGLPSNSLRAVTKHLKNVRAKGLSYTNDNNFAVTGWLDSVTRVPTGGVTVNGWACAKNWSDSINVHIYVENVGARAITANRASEPAVAASCSSTGTAYRYSEFFSENDRRANVGKRIFVYGISPFDLANNGLLGNGKPVP